MPYITGNDEKLIAENESVKILHNRMINREGRSTQTLARYLSGIKAFTNFLKAKNPDQALKLFIECSDRTGKLDEFIDYLINQKNSAIDVKAKWYGVKRWLITNRVNNIDWEYISRPKAISQIQDRIPTKQELQRILDNKVTLRDKSFYLMIASSGFRLGTALTLQVKDYQPIEELGMITVKGADGRKLAQGKSYFTFITPEARRYLEEYLETRKPLAPEDPLFICESPKYHGKRFGYSCNLSRQWTILVRRAKLLEKAPNSKNFTLHGHSLRKFFQTHTKLSGCRADFVDFWMGHHPTGSSEYLNDSYFRPDLKMHLTEYRKAVASLTVYGTDQTKLSELEQEINDLRRVQKENLELQQRVEGLENFLVDLQKAFATEDKSKDLRERFAVAKKEREQRFLEMQQYLKLHPELKLKPGEKFTLEKHEQFRKGFNEYQNQKKKHD